MSEYPKKLVLEGSIANVNDAADEATLKAMGYKGAPQQAAEEKPKRKTPMRSPQLSTGPKKRKP